MSAMELDDSVGGSNGIGTAIDFTTLGMFIIDEIHFPPPTPPVRDILGGAGAFSALGARIFSPPPLSKSVAWIVDCGSDFPADIYSAIDQWDTGCVLRNTPDRLTTRGLNGYEGNEFRTFRYLTPKIRLDHLDLTPAMLRSKSFHFICSPKRCMDLVEGTMKRRREDCPGDDLRRPLFLWEPVPDLCTPAELDMCRQALRKVEVVSPNHMELAAFFGLSGARGDSVDHEVVEQCASEWLSSGIGLENGPGALVVRAGKDGCYIATRKQSKWLPAYFRTGDRAKDPTGGGNAFLGGLAVALSRDKSLLEGAIWGTIAASFAIEQVGVPRLTKGSGGERWNGERVAERLDTYLQRL